MCLRLSVRESRREMYLSLCARVHLCMCFPRASVLCVCMSVHPSNSSVPRHEAHMCHLMPAECRADLSGSSLTPPHAHSPPHPRPSRQRKEQESIEMNGQPSASWLELNGNVNLAMDPFCLSVEGPVSLGSPNRIIPSRWQSTPHYFHFMSLLSV